MANALDLQKGYREHLSMHGLFDFSVQYHASLSWQELARLGQYPHAQLSIGHESDLRAGLQSLGCDLRLVASPGAGYHHT